MPPRRIKLAVINGPAWGTRSIMRLELGEPPFKNVDTDVPDYLCGTCGRVLVTNMALSRIRGVVIQCSCLAFNDTNFR